jgi:DNA-binding response OmpR family regulator
MIFVVAGGRDRLADVTELLLSIFAGSTIYQHADPLRVPKDAFRHKVNGVFLEAEFGGCNGIDLMRELRRQKHDIPVYIFSDTESLRVTAAKAGADGYFVYPLAEETVKNTLLAKQ